MTLRNPVNARVARKLPPPRARRGVARFAFLPRRFSASNFSFRPGRFPHAENTSGVFIASRKNGSPEGHPADIYCRFKYRESLNKCASYSFKNGKERTNVLIK